MKNVIYTDSANFHCLENLRENSLDLSLVHAGTEHCFPGHTFSSPRDEYIIHFVLDGTGTYSAGGNTWVLTPGQMFIIYPNEPVTYSADQTTPWSYAWIGFNGIRAESFIKQCGFSKGRLILPAPDSQIILKYISKILEHKSLTHSNELKREAYLMLLLSELIEHHDSLKLQTRKEKYAYSTSVYVEMAIDFIRQAYRYSIGVADIADNIKISRAYLNNAFQKELGMSAQKFLIDYRMHKAASLLTSTALSVKEVGNRVGYEDQLTFSKAFKKKFGLSPRNYKVHQDQIIKYDEKQ